MCIRASSSAVLSRRGKSRIWLMRCRGSVSYTHLDVYKSQLQCGIKPKGEVKDLADALPWICLLYTSRCV
ncbi:hypothetical protein [Erwinia amylovora]